MILKIKEESQEVVLNDSMIAALTFNEDEKKFNVTLNIMGRNSIDFDYENLENLDEIRRAAKELERIWREQMTRR